MGWVWWLIYIYIYTCYFWRLHQVLNDLRMDSGFNEKQNDLQNETHLPGPSKGCQMVIKEYPFMSKCKIHLLLCWFFASWIEYLGQWYEYVWGNACDYCCIIILIYSFFYLFTKFHGKNTSLNQSRTLWNTIYSNNTSFFQLDYFWQQATLQPTKLWPVFLYPHHPLKNSTKTSSKPSFLATVQPPPPGYQGHMIWRNPWDFLAIYCTCYRNTLLMQAYTQFSLPEEIRSFFKSKTSDLNLYTFKNKMTFPFKDSKFFSVNFSSSSSLPKVFPCQLLGWPPERHRFGWSFPPRSAVRRHLEGGSTKDAAGVTTTHARPLFLEVFFGALISVELSFFWIHFLFWECHADARCDDVDVIFRSLRYLRKKPNSNICFVKSSDRFSHDFLGANIFFYPKNRWNHLLLSRSLALKPRFLWRLFLPRNHFFSQVKHGECFWEMAALALRHVENCDILLKFVSKKTTTGL